MKPCINCGSDKHSSKDCTEPFKSYGIILLKFYNDDKDIQLGDVKNLDSIITILNIDKSNNELIQKINNYIKTIKILLISRKHSLGYCEFIRGNYKISNSISIMNLFQQMNSNEIHDIKTKTFDELWTEFWIKDYKNFYYHDSKSKFNLLKSGTIDLSLDFFSKTTLLYDSPEWGFPKGRKNNFNENVLKCATRELKEETNYDYNKNEITLLSSIYPVKEEMTGTDGKKYIHIYYIAKLNVDKIPIIDETNIIQQREIGSVGFFSFDEVLSMIRDYHIIKKKIIIKIIAYFTKKTFKL